VRSSVLRYLRHGAIHESGSAIITAMWRKASVLVVGLLVAPLGPTAPATAAAKPNYCIRPINVVPAPETPHLIDEFDSAEPLPDAPGTLVQSDRARFPMAFQPHRIKRPDGTEANHSLFWSFSSHFELVGPRDYKNVFGPIASDDSGRTLALGSIGERSDSGHFQTHHVLLEQRDESVFDDANPTLQAAIADPQLLVWSDVFDAFVVFSVEWREEPSGNGQITRVGEDRIFVIKGNTPSRLPNLGLNINVIADLPSLSVVTLLGSDALAIASPGLEATKVARVDPGRHGFEAAYETRDPGWI
jgi:hypothetical protein